MVSACIEPTRPDAYVLTRIDDDTYEISGPDNRFSMVRFLAEMPEGQWWSEWVGSGSLFIMRLHRQAT